MSERLFTVKLLLSTPLSPNPSLYHRPRSKLVSPLALPNRLYTPALLYLAITCSLSTSVSPIPV